jgi:hypothetical protein
MPLCGGVECLRQMGQPVMQASTLKSRQATPLVPSSTVALSRESLQNLHRTVQNSRQGLVLAIRSFRVTLNAHCVIKMQRIQPVDFKTSPATFTRNVCVPFENWRPVGMKTPPLRCEPL